MSEWDPTPRKILNHSYLRSNKVFVVYLPYKNILSFDQKNEKSILKIKKGKKYQNVVHPSCNTRAGASAFDSNIIKGWR